MCRVQDKSIVASAAIRPHLNFPIGNSLPSGKAAAEGVLLTRQTVAQSSGENLGLLLSA